MTTTSYYYLKPGTLETSGFCYGLAEQDDSDVGEKIHVKRVASGRWRELDTYSAEFPVSTVKHREVSKEEAHKGVGTYVGSCVCVAHRWNGGVERWTYGVVTGFKWSAMAERCVLHITAAEGNFEFIYEAELLQDLAAETYAMRLCDGKSTLSVMPTEMRSIHEAAYKLFNARGRSAVRSVATICERLEMETVEETGIVPLFDISEMEVSHVSTKYILDFIFYHDGRRQIPATIKLGGSVFEEPDEEAVPEVTAVEVNPARARSPLQEQTGTGLDPLEESDDDSEEGMRGVPKAGISSVARETVKRARG